MTNGTLPGYVFTPEAIAEGGYEVGTSIFTGEAGKAIVDGNQKFVLRNKFFIMIRSSDDREWRWL